MNRIAEVDPGRAKGRTKGLFNTAQSKLGAVPDFVRILGNTPAALEGYLQFSDALSSGSFNARVREQVAVAESNLCVDCMNSQKLNSSKVGLSEKDIVDARHAIATEDKTDAIVKLVRSVVVQRGQLSDTDLKSARRSGLSDAEIVETVANVALNIFTNYVNHINHSNN